MWSFAAYCEVPFCGLPNETVTPGSFELFALSPAQSRVLVEITARELSSEVISDFIPDPYCTFAFCDIPGASIARTKKVFYFSNGKFFGRPDDSLRANKRYAPRLLNSADIERSLPQDPDQDRRGEISIGGIDFANPDGALDYLLTDYSVADLPVTVRLVESDGYVQNGKITGVFFGDRFEATRDRITLRLKSVTDYLAKPLYSRYTGTGGINGDANLKGTVKPVAYGPCFNPTPVLINRANWIYQIHDGRVFAIDTVRDGGLDLINDGDVSDFTDLVNTDVTAGHYITCLDLGLFKAGLGVAGPQWLITCDVRGDTDATGDYTADLGQVLLRVATDRAGLGAEFINKPSFGQLPKADISYFVGQEEKTCAQVFNELLSGIFGCYAPDRSNFLKVGVINSPNTETAGSTITERLAIDIEELPYTIAPRYKQTVNYGKNWTPLSADQISDAVGTVPTTATRDQLTGENEGFSTITVAAVLAKRLDAEEGAPVQSYFVGDQAPAAATEVANRVMAYTQEDRHLYRVTTYRFNYLLNNLDVLQLQNNRFGLSGGKNGLVMSLRDSGKGEGGEITMLV